MVGQATAGSRGRWIGLAEAWSALQGGAVPQWSEVPVGGGSTAGLGHFACPGPSGPPGMARGACVVFPGGGYNHLAEHEGAAVAGRLNAMGLEAFVLRYRHAPEHRHPAPLEDARRALQVVRAGAASGWWGVDGGRVAVLGFSAGGHLAALLATEPCWKAPAEAADAEAYSPLPDAHVLCYPVISLVGPFAHGGSGRCLLADALDAVGASLNADARVHGGVSPVFLWHTGEDASVPAANSIAYAQAMLRHGRSVDLHIWQPGRHGLGLAEGSPEMGRWADLLAGWFGRLGWFGRPSFR